MCSYQPVQTAVSHGHSGPIQTTTSLSPSSTRGHNQVVLIEEGTNRQSC